MNYKIKGCSILEIHTTKCKYDESYTTKQMYVQGLKLCTTKQVQCTLESCTKNESTLEIVLSFQNFAENI